MDQLIDTFLIGLTAAITSAIIAYVFQRVQNRSDKQDFSANRTLVHFLIAVFIGGIPLALFRLNVISGNRWAFLIIFFICLFVSYRILQTDEDVPLPKAVDKLLYGWPGKIWSGLKRTTGRRRGLIVIMTIFALAFVGLFISVLWLLREPDPLAVLIQLGDADPDKINPNEALEVLEGHLDEFGLETYDLELRDELRGGQENDLAIAVRMSQEDCQEGELVSYTWTWQVQPAGSPLDELVRFYMAGYDFGQDGSIEVRYLCDGRDTTAEVIASFILFVNGLHRSLASLENPRLPEANVSGSFSKAITLLDEVTHGQMPTVKTAGRRDEQLELAQHLYACVQTFAFVEVESLYLNSASNLGGRREALIDLVEAEKQPGAKPPADVCIAQAYYWLGRDALNDYLAASANTIPSQANANLTQAEQYFTHAIDAYKLVAAPSDGVTATGYHWLYYFYLGLTQYRQGRLERAGQSFDAAERSYQEYSFNPFPKELLAYMKARIRLEGVAYSRRDEVDGVCQEAVGGPLAANETAVLQSLRYLNDQDGETQGPLNLGIMSLFHQALYQYSPTSLPSQPRLPSEAITAAERSLVKANNFQTGYLAEDVVLLEALLDNLYTFNDPSTALLDDKGLKAFRQQAGAVAYVLPFWPRLQPDSACGGEAIIDLSAGRPLAFLWRLRNSDDEPVFFSHHDQPQSEDVTDPAKLGSATCEFAYCLRIGTDEHWPLVDRGYGLFEAAQTVPFSASVTAIGLGGDDHIILSGNQNIALVHVLEGKPTVRPVGKLEFQATGSLELVEDETRFITGNLLRVTATISSDDIHIQRVTLDDTYSIQADVLYKIDAATNTFDQVEPFASQVFLNSLGQTIFVWDFALDSDELDIDEYRIRVFIEDTAGRKGPFIRYEVAPPTS